MHETDTAGDRLLVEEALRKGWPTGGGRVRCSLRMRGSQSKTLRKLLDKGLRFC